MPIRYELLADAIAAALQDSLGLLAEQVDPRELAVFGLYTSGELNYLGPTAETKSHWQSLPFPWSPPAWEFHGFTKECFRRVDDLLIEGWSDDYSSFEVDHNRLLSIVTNILKDVRQRHFENSDVLVGLFVAGGHQWIGDSIAAINPPDVA